MIRPSINVTPLIDVLLVLLIIFMVVAPSHPGQFETKIPSKPESDHEAVSDELLVVTLESTDRIFLNHLRLTLDELERRLAYELAARPDPVVILRASQSLRYHEVVRVIDRIKGAGAHPIGLQVDLL